MELEVFIISAIYWISILAVFVWLSKRHSDLKKKLDDLESRK